MLCHEVEQVKFTCDPITISVTTATNQYSRSALLPVLQASKLNSFEVPKAIHLDSVAWEAGGLVTPTFKLKRHDARQFYAAPVSWLTHHTASTYSSCIHILVLIHPPSMWMRCWLPGPSR